MSQRAARGALIVIEGCDRVGKSTHCERLVKALNSQDVPAELIKFPNRQTLIGSLINRYLQGEENVEDHAIHLLFSANRWESVPDMLNRLQKGTTLVVDRYAYSGAAYSAAKQGFGLRWCMQSDVGLPRPDLVVWLNLEPSTAAAREGFGIERYEETSFQKRVRDNFDRLMEFDTDNWKVINADAEADSVHQQIMEYVLPVVHNKLEALQTLWTNKQSHF